jgi:hypothetical protein
MSLPTEEEITAALIWLSSGAHPRVYFHSEVVERLYNRGLLYFDRRPVDFGMYRGRTVKFLVLTPAGYVAAAAAKAARAGLEAGVDAECLQHQ